MMIGSRDEDKVQGHVIFFTLSDLHSGQTDLWPVLL
jgi:hypothetical protein